MPIETVLRHLVFWQWLLAFLSIVIFQLEAKDLPFLLQEYAAQRDLAPAGPGEQLIGWYALAWTVGSVVASVGVFRLRRWARLLFLAMAALGCVLQAFLEPSVTTAWSATAETAAQVVVGVTIGVLYFSPVRGHFARRSAS